MFTAVWYWMYYKLIITYVTVYLYVLQTKITLLYTVYCLLSHDYDPDNNYSVTQRVESKHSPACTSQATLEIAKCPCKRPMLVVHAASGKSGALQNQSKTVHSRAGKSWWVRSWRCPHKHNLAQCTSGWSLRNQGLSCPKLLICGVLPIFFFGIVDPPSKFRPFFDVLAKWCAQPAGWQLECIQSWHW